MPCWLWTTGSPSFTSARSRTMPSALMGARPSRRRDLAHLSRVELGFGHDRDALAVEHESRGDRAEGEGERMGRFDEARPVVHQRRMEIVLARRTMKASRGGRGFPPRSRMRPSKDSAKDFRRFSGSTLRRSTSMAGTSEALALDVEARQVLHARRRGPRPAGRARAARAAAGRDRPSAGRSATSSPSRTPRRRHARRHARPSWCPAGR